MPKYLLLFVILFSNNTYAFTPEEIVKKSQQTFFYQGEDFKARVIMKLITKNGQERIRELIMLRKNYGKAGEQKYFMYFLKPLDVKDMAFMVFKYPAKDDDRWIFIPAINMTRRIASKDKHSSFVGSDFTYEDVSGRDTEDDTNVILKEEEFNNKACYVVKSSPKAQDVDYSYKISWIDKNTFLPLKEEYYDKKSELYKTFTADEIKNINGFSTITKRTMENIKTGHRTEVGFTKVFYNIGIENELFSERFLKNPPKKWIE